MSENKGMYGYSDDTTTGGTNLHFGGNFGNVFMTKFAYTTQGGKGGAVGEALDITFTINGIEKSYRKFPVTKAFIKGGGETTDPNSPEMIEAGEQFSKSITHILKCFVSEETIAAAMQGITSFKQFCDVAAGLLPATYATIELDIFLEWEYKIKGQNDKTYLQIPQNNKNGNWLCVHIAPVGSWHEVVETNHGLKYLDDSKNEHPFKKSDYFVNGAQFLQQKEGQNALDAAKNTSATGGKTAW